MLNTMPITILIGAILGFLAGIGVGGGSLLMLWLTLVLGMDHNAAKIINLLFFLPSAAIASIFRRKQGVLKLGKVFPAILSGCIAAAVFSWLSKRMDITLIKNLFGLLLLFTGLRELFYRPRNAK